MKKKLYISTAALAVLLIVIFLLVKPFEEDAEADIIIQPQFGEFEVAVTATGELQAKNSVKIYGPMNARIANVWQMKISKLVPEGTVVKQGEFVADLDRSEISSKIKDLEIEIQKSESRYIQAKLDTTLTLSKARDELVNLTYAKEEAKLRKEQSVYEAPAVQRQADIDYEKAVRNYEQAVNNYQTQVQQAIAKCQEIEAELTQHRQKMNLYNDILKGFTVNAPADGMVIYAKEWNGQKKTEGSIVQGWDPVVATLPDLSVMESITYVNEVDIKKVKAGQEVKIGLDADPDKQLTGKVTDIANIGEQRPNSDSKVFEVKIVINEADSTLRPAMTTSNTIVVAQVDSVLHVPLESIFNDDSLTYVFKKNGSGVIKQEVALGLINDYEAVIQRGVSRQDQLFLSKPEKADDITVIRLEATPKLTSQAD
jgi:multidrug efflux pump subunit AcrA (membrane-fusion protein)